MTKDWQITTSLDPPLVIIVRYPPDTMTPVEAAALAEALEEASSFLLRYENLPEEAAGG